MVDASASEAGRTPAADLTALVEELRLYDEDLLLKPALVLANKYDLDGEWKDVCSIVGCCMCV